MEQKRIEKMTVSSKKTYAFRVRKRVINSFFKMGTKEVRNSGTVELKNLRKSMP